MSGIEVSVPVPAGILDAVWRLMLPPTVSFGSPVQRAKTLEESWWHIPVNVARKWRVGPDEIFNVRAYAELLRGGSVSQTLRLYWGDAQFEKVSAHGHLEAGRVSLLPVVWRHEGSDPFAYITDQEFFSKDVKKHRIGPDRVKHKLRLFLETKGRTHSFAE